MQIRPKFGQISKIFRKGQTKYLRPNYFWKQQNFQNDCRKAKFPTLPMI